jgi:hypothetical protein
VSEQRLESDLRTECAAARLMASRHWPKASSAANRLTEKQGEISLSATLLGDD